MTPHSTVRAHSTPRVFELSRRTRPNRKTVLGWSGRGIEALEGRLLMDAGLMQIENQRVLNLAPDGSFQAISISSGKWDSPGTWGNGHVPVDGDSVLIANGTTVKITADEAIKINTDQTVSRRAVKMLRVDGTLAFDTSNLGANPNALRRLLVDTIIVSPMNMMMGTAMMYQNDSSMAGGSLQMGTATDPMPYGIKASVVFADNGPVFQTDTSVPEHNPSDPYELGRGLLVMGSANIYGSSVTSQATIAPTAASGETSVGPASHTNLVTKLTLTSVPTDWHVGDRLIITGNTATNDDGHNQDEQVAIAAIDPVNKTVTINDPSQTNYAGLAYRHSAPAGASIYIADVTRNVTFASENPNIVADRGHTMFMHTLDVHIDAAGFYGLGRTDKRNPIDDPVLVKDYDSSGNLIPGQFTTDVLDTSNPALKSHGYRVMIPVVDGNGNPVLNTDGSPKMQIARTGLNPRARYAVHFHHAMADDMMSPPVAGTAPSGPATINDSAVVDSPGWGIVNHSSDVNITNNVVYNALGAGFVTEAGDEIGTFDHNIAIHSQGSGDGIEERTQFQDFGHQGDGFWFQGGNVSVTNNVAAGQRHSGFVFFPVGLIQKGVTTTIPVSAIADQPWAPTDPKIKSVAVGDVPLRQFSGNTAYGVGDGFESWFSLLSVNNRHDVIKNLTVFNTDGTAVFTPYSNNPVFDHVRLLGNLGHPGGTGFARNHVTANASYIGVDVKGFSVGIDAPVNGVNTISGGTFENVKNIVISTANSRDRVVAINDGTDSSGHSVPISFVPLPITVTPASRQFDIYLNSNFNPHEHDITSLFNPDIIRLGTVTINGKQIYYNEQASDYVPFPVGTSESYIPHELLGLTNAQIYSTYGLAIGGIIAPSNATRMSRINGLVGDVLASYPTNLKLTSHKYTQFAADGVTVAPYTLSYKYADPAHPGSYITVRETTPTTLHAGWNFLSRTVNGSLRTLLVYGDDTPPDFVINSHVPLIINTADFNNHAIWKLEGQVTDDSFGSRFFRKNFTLGDTHFFSAFFQKPDGKSYTTFSMTITDLAGNSKIWKLDLQVSDSAPLQKDLGRTYLPDIIPSDTLIALITIDPVIPPKKP